jgi:hypothetical protein
MAAHHHITDTRRVFELYVDGGVTGNILYAARAEEEDALPAVWQRTYSDVPIPKVRYWVIFNNQFRPVPHVTPPKWLAVVQRSLETATRASTATACFRAFVASS